MWYSHHYFRDLSLEQIKNKKKNGLVFSDIYLDYVIENFPNFRLPISVVCPDGRIWCVDSCSVDGKGWIVEGEVPKITCSPSIVTSGYHGFLKEGVFTPS